MGRSKKPGWRDGLLFSFADEIVDVREIWLEIQLLSRTDLGRSILAQLVYAHIARLRICYRPATYDATQVDIGVALEEFSRRKVSMPADEALCLATLLRLDRNEITRCGAERKMEAVWRLQSESIQGLRQKLIFSMALRLSTPGYRWASKPLLTNMMVVDLAFEGRNDAKAYLTTHGLQVATVGWRVRIVEPPQGIEQVSALESFNTALRHNVYIADAQGRFFCLAARGSNESWIKERPSTERDQKRLDLHGLLRQREKQWHILFDDPHGRETERGLLAYLHRYEDGILVLRSVLVVSVGVVMPSWTRIWRTGQFYGNAMRRAWFVKCLQLLTTHEQILGSILVTISHLAKQSQVMRRQKLFKQYRHMLENELHSGQLKVLRQATELEYVMQARTAVGKKEDEVMGLPLWMLIAFSGHYAVVRQEFSATQQWYVD